MKNSGFLIYYKYLFVKMLNFSVLFSLCLKLYNKVIIIFFIFI